MPQIQLLSQDLPSRGSEIQQILIPVAKQKGGPAWGRRVGSTEFIIGTHDGSPPTSDYRHWTFATFRRDFRAQYFERWLKFVEDNDEGWYLERAYLNIYRYDVSRDGREYICLHTDPDCVPDKSIEKRDPILYRKLVKQAPYKRLPHIHVVAAEQPLPHAHIALNVGFFDEVLDSVESLSRALKQGVQLLRDEVLEMKF